LYFWDIQHDFFPCVLHSQGEREKEARGMGRNPTKELREKIEELSEKLHEEQEKRMLYDVIITIFLTIFIVVSPMIFAHIFAWYQSLDEFNKGAFIGIVSFIIAFSITRILIWGLK
jgi:uncharacterized membrane protein (DUF485 family)